MTATTFSGCCGCSLWTPRSRAGLVFVVVTLPLLWAWGHFLADIELNPFLDDPARQRWRLVVYLVPGALAFYWHRYVRAARTLI